jgi:hypothetical protein
MKTKFHSRFVGGIVSIAIAVGLAGGVSTSTAAIAFAQPTVASVQPEGFTTAHSGNWSTDYPFYPHCNRFGCEGPVFPRPWYDGWRDGWREPWYGPVPPPWYVPIWEEPQPCGCRV